MPVWKSVSILGRRVDRGQSLSFAFGMKGMSAKFRVEAVFSVKGRGTVLQGTIVSCTVGAGMHIVTADAHTTRRVVAIKGLHGQQTFLGSVGMVLDDSESDAAGDCRAPRQGTVLDIA